MIVKMNGQVIENAFNEITHPSIPVMNGQPFPTEPILMANVPDLNIDQIVQTLTDIGQEILIGTAGVFAVICGIMIAVGLKREGWKRFSSVFQGLGVGLIGPAVVTLAAAFFVSLSGTIV